MTLYFHNPIIKKRKNVTLISVCFFIFNYKENIGKNKIPTGKLGFKGLVMGSTPSKKNEKVSTKITSDEINIYIFSKSQN
jgi:hypothetical protein